MTVLTGFAVNPAAYTCAGSVKLVSGNHPGSHWAEGVEGFAQVPLLVTHLHVSCRYVVHDGIAEHMLQGVVLAYVLSTGTDDDSRSEEHTSELQSLMRISYAVFCLKKKKTTKIIHNQ